MTDERLAEILRDLTAARAACAMHGIIPYHPASMDAIDELLAEAKRLREHLSDGYDIVHQLERYALLDAQSRSLYDECGEWKNRTAKMLGH